MTSRHFQEGQCAWLFQGDIKDNSSLLKGIFSSLPIGFWTQLTMFAFIWKISLFLLVLGVIKGDLQAVAGNAEIFFIFLFSRFYPIIAVCRNKNVS